MTPPPKDNDYEALKKLWYNKLKSEGFNDIEREDGLLKSWASSEFVRAFRQGRGDVQKSKEEYYRAAGHFLHEYEFPTPLEREIWQLHSDGMSSRNIAKTLNKKGVKTYREKIEPVIRKLAAEMRRRCGN